MNYENVVKSFFLGAVIGLVLQFVYATPGEVRGWTTGILISGALGLLIGLATEWLTALLPIRIARVRTYFVVNNFIAVAVTASVMVLLVAIADEEARSGVSLWPLLGLVVSIVCVANLVDYLGYARSQRRLLALRESLTDADAD